MEVGGSFVINVCGDSFGMRSFLDEGFPLVASELQIKPIGKKATSKNS